MKTSFLLYVTLCCLFFVGCETNEPIGTDNMNSDDTKIETGTAEKLAIDLPGRAFADSGNLTIALINPQVETSAEGSEGSSDVMSVGVWVYLNNEEVKPQYLRLKEGKSAQVIGDYEIHILDIKRSSYDYAVIEVVPPSINE